MKKILLRALGILIGAVLFAVIFIFTLLPQRRAAPDIQVDITPENIARGRYMAVNVLQCVDCHSERDWTLYGGPPKKPLGAGRACMTRETMAEWKPRIDVGVGTW